MRKFILGAIAVAGAGVSYAHKKFYESEDVKCKECERKFKFMQRHRITCEYSGDIVCKDCIEMYLPGIPVAKGHIEEVKEKAKAVVVVKANTVEGHRVQKRVGRVLGSKPYQDRKHAEKDLIFQCVRKGGNAILDFEISSETHWHISDGAPMMIPGLPGMKIHTPSRHYLAEGSAVILIKGHRKPGDVPYMVADEIDKLAKLLKKGALSQEEYDFQKAKLLGHDPLEPEEESQNLNPLAKEDESADQDSASSTSTESAEEFEEAKAASDETGGDSTPAGETEVSDEK